MKSLLTLVSVIVIALGMTGCKSPGIFATTFDDGKKDMVVLDTTPVFPNTVAVTDFKDLRGDSNSAGTVFWSLCPLMPFGWVSYDRPEHGKAMMNTANYKHDMIASLANAVAVSFDTSRIFNSTYASRDINDLKGDLILDAEIYTARFDAKLISYGLTFVSPVLWVVGLPATYLDSQLDMKLRLYHRSTEKIVWEYPIKVEESGCRWAYGRTSEEIEIFPKMVREALNKAIPELEKYLDANPTLLDDKAVEKKAEETLEKANQELDNSKKEQQEVKEAEKTAPNI